ncbi:MAG TPA: PKD domain-containing protein, partial [Solirubrobacteraceae bacterium]
MHAPICGEMPRAALALALLVVAALAGAAPAAARRAPVKHPALRVVSHGDRIPRGADRRLRRQVRRGRLARAAAAVPEAPLAGTWCGAATAADDVVHQAAAGKAIKVVYAHPADVPDRFESYASVIAAAINVVQGAFLEATGGERTVRFDVGTPCGANYLDIQSVTLPKPAAQYSADDVATLTGDLKPLVAGSPSCPTVTSTACTRDFLVFADGVYKNDFVTGVASRRTDERPGADNSSNRGGLFAYVLGDGSANFGISPATTAEHELLHNLGAVQASALHSTGAGHCFDVIDVMCYPDGGPRISISGLLSACPGALTSNIDCGHDDYFNPDGPVLNAAQVPIWNIDDSAFLCALSACVTGNLAPVASFTATDGAHAGEPVTFDATASTDEAGPPASYAWDVDGDGVTDGEGAMLAHVYANAGTYEAQLTVTDVAGARATTTRTVVVAPPVP